MQFRMTNGQLLPGRDANFGGTQTFIETYAATVSFGVSDGTCWYLDSAFCSTFHQMKKWSTPSNVLMATRLLCFFIFASAALSLLFRCRVFGALHRRAKRKKKVGGEKSLISCSCRKRCYHIYEEAATWSVLGVTMQLVLIVCPPMVQFQIFEPCFECYDFEGAAVHEIGHVLGLGHPNTAREEVDASYFDTYGTRGDNVYNQRLAELIRYNESTCYNTWGDVRNNTPPNAEVDSTGCKRGYNDELITGCVGIRDSVMEAFTQNNPSVCLAQDDLEAIHTLYPDCELSVTEVVCYKVNLNLGIVRIAVYVLGPLLIIFGVVVLMQAVIQNHNREEIKEQKVMIKEHRKEVVAGRFKLACANNLAEQARANQGANQAASESRSASRSPSRKNSPRSGGGLGWLKTKKSSGLAKQPGLVAVCHAAGASTSSVDSDGDAGGAGLSLAAAALANKKPQTIAQRVLAAQAAEQAQQASTSSDDGAYPAMDTSRA
uniref:Uncharacterized protein n=1 Tax=Haptolina ericina TaxID=156174 RepID=A0A7S3AEA7_9EUKA